MKFTSKVVNKIGLILAVFAAVLCFGLFTISSASFSAYAKADTKPDKFIGPQITITKAQSSYSVSDIITTAKVSDSSEVKGIKLPLVAGTGLTVTAKSATGKTAEVLADSEVKADLGGSYLLVPEFFAGKYYVTYTATQNNVKTTKKIVVAFDSARIEFEDVAEQNTKNIIPEYINPGKTITLGYPNIILDGDTENPISTSDATKGTLTVSVVKPNGDETVLTPNEGVFSYTIPTDNAEGSYKIKYAYIFKSTEQEIAKSYSFSVVSTDEFNPEEDVSLKISSWSSSLDDMTLSVGVEQTLPTPTVINSQDNTTQKTYVTVDVDYYDTVNSKWISFEEGITDFKFTPTKTGEYRFKYTCEAPAYYGNVAAATRISANIKANLSSSTLGLKLSSVGYDPTDPAFDREAFYESTEDASYMVPTMIKAGTEVTLPALIASAYGNYELVYTLTVAGNSKTYNETPTYTFENTGTYTVNYQVSYKDNTNQRIQRTFEVQVVSALSDTDVTLDGTINGLATTVKAGNELNFTVSATDIVTNPDSALYNQTADADIEKVVTAKIDGTSVAKDDIIKNEDGSYTIKVPATTAAGKIVEVKLSLTDDLGNTKDDIIKNITVINNSADTLAPTLDTTALPADAVANYSFNRGDEVPVFALKATDTKTATIPNSSTSINVTVKNGGNTVLEKSVFSLYDGTNYVAEIKDNQFKFVLSNSGIYTVTYSAIDSNNNESILTYQIWSESNSTPGITLSGLQSSANVGETIELSDAAKVSKDGEYVDYNTVLITDASAKDDILAYAQANLDTNTTIILVEGEFTAGDTATSIVARGDIDLTVWAYGDNVDPAKRIDANAYKTATITVSDTTSPEFTISGQGESDRNIALVDGKATIDVDWFATADDAALGYEGKGVKTLSVKATYESDSESVWSLTKAPDEDVDATELRFEATKNGKIDVVYTVADYANNETTKTLIYYVGDCVAPVVSFGDQDLTKTITTGGDFSVDLTQLTAKDAGTTYTYGDSGMSFSIKLAQDGTDISSRATTADNKWTVNELEAGTYVLTVSATDTAGNISYTQSRTFKVESKSSGKVTSTTVWGTILIILALVILAGVIFFFVRPTKAKVKVANSTKKVEKKEETTETKSE